MKTYALCLLNFTFTNDSLFESKKIFVLRNINNVVTETSPTIYCSRMKLSILR